MGSTSPEKRHTVWDHPGARLLLPLAAVVVPIAVLNPILDYFWDDPVPHSVAVGTAPTGPYPTVDPERLIPEKCPGVRDVIRLINDSWDRDKDARHYQDYFVQFGLERRDVARLYLDDGSVRCP